MRHALLKLLCAAALLPATQALLAAPEARVIVKFKADSSLMRKQAFAETQRAPTRAQALADRLGLPLRSGLAIAEDTQVVLGSGMASEELAQRLSAQADVEYAVVDGRKRRLAVPNDPRYASGPAVNLGTQTGGPVVGQWYLRAPDSTFVSATNAIAAWDVTVGSPGIVVAVIDTGVRFDHPDLLPVAQGGNLLQPGYDMISDALISNKGGATRSSDASDPGDWLTQADINANPGSALDNCTPEPTSSWHGTQVSGIIAASTNNNLGMASMGRNVRVVPVRALGRCGGFDSDIVAAMRWAGGLPVSHDVPANPNPARVINMSLGGGTGCAPSYRDAVTALTAAGVTIVAAAGNAAGTPVSEPAACAGVIAVAGVRHAGTKVGFSNMGPEVSLSAPGGNCVNTANGTACLYPILTTANSGLTSPVTNANGGSIYTDSFNSTIGTSFSSPLVAGAAALMLSVQANLTPGEVRALLRSTARAFPTSGADTGGEPITACPAPTAGVEVGQCYCTSTTCGAGMLDAGAAVLAAAGAQARIGVSPATGTVGQPVTLSSVSLVPADRTISAYQWTLTDNGGIVSSFTGATNGATASLTPVAAGSFTVSLRITDSGGVVTTATQTVSVQTVAPPPPPPPADSGGGGALGLGWLLALALAVLAVQMLRPRGA